MPNAPITCARCGDRVTSGQKAFERISDGYVPLHGSGAVRFPWRTGQVVHAFCLPEHVRGEQLTMWQGEP